MLIRKFSICVICGKEFIPSPNQKVCSQECRKKRKKQYWGKWYIKNHKHFQEENRIYNALCSKEMERYKTEYCEGNYSKAKIDLYQVIIFFSSIIIPVVQFFYLMFQYNKKCKLFIKKERRVKEERQLMRIRIKELKEYCKSNKIDYNKEWHRRNANKKYKTDLKHQLNHKMKVAIYISLKRSSKKSRHWEDLVGYTLKKLEKRLQETMPKSYDWQDFMEGKLHVDHIIPISAFNFTKPEHLDFKRCWSLDNLRLLPAEENRIKWSKLKKPFQPALQLTI